MIQVMNELVVNGASLTLLGVSEDIHNFATILVFFLVGAVFVIGGLVTSWLVRPNVKEKMKGDVYECGEVAEGSTWIRFNNRIWTVALVFIVFDVEVIFIFPLAAVFRSYIGPGGDISQALLVMTEIVLFVVILAVGLAYVWAKGDLDWMYELKWKGKKRNI